MMATKFHPILFSTPMVQAIQENRKKLTRRTKGLEKINENPDNWKFDRYSVDMAFDQIGCIFSNDYEEIHIPFNNVKIYDVFWVRETYHQIHNSVTDAFLRFGYKADKDYKGAKWTPSIFMPKAACRTFLKIKSICVERLNEISEEDAIAEGIEKIADYGSTGYRLYTEPDAAYSDIDAISSFESLWISINGKDSWNKNPFVWVYEFEKIEKPNDFIV